MSCPDVAAFDWSFFDIAKGLIQDSVCPIGPLTLHIPNFIFFGSVFLVAWALVACVWGGIKRWYPAFSDLRSLEKQIAGIPPHDLVLDAEGYEKLGEIFKKPKHRRLRPLWEEFRETLLFEADPEGRRLVFNTRAAAEFFPREVLINERCKVELYRVIPGLFTGLGLVLTFLAILVGLSGIMDADGTIQNKQVEILVSNLSGKFVSSITALLLATILVLLERLATSSLEKRYKEFIQCLDGRFQRRSSEYLLEKIALYASQSANSTRQLSSDLAVPIRVGVQEGITPLVERLTTIMDRMNVALDGLTQEKSNTLEQSLERIIGEFRKTLFQSAGSEMKGVQDALRSTTDVLMAANSQSKETNDRMTRIISEFDGLIRKQAESGSGAIEKLAAAMESVTAKLGATSEASAQQMSERIAAMLQGLESTSSKVLEESRKQSESLEQIVLNLTNSVQQSMGSVTSAVSTTVNDLMAKTSATTDAARDNIDRLIGANQASLSELQHAQTTLRDTLSAFDGAMNGVRETARQLDSAGKLFEQSGEEIKAGASALSSHSSFLKSIFSDFKSVVESLEAENRRIQQLNGEYPRIFSEIDSSLASILKQIEERTEVYNQSMRKGVGETVSSLDNHLQRATKTFGDTIEDLEDKFSDLSELLEKLLRRK